MWLSMCGYPWVAALVWLSMGGCPCVVIHGWLPLCDYPWEAALVWLSMCGNGRLISIIGPQSKQYTGAPTYTATHRNKNVNVDKIKHIFIVLVLPPKSVFKRSKTCRTQQA